tara:strand:- start:3881 stop:4429 length:549 start_codon:yes stop_codon:yes gene_type:complete
MKREYARWSNPVHIKNQKEGMESEKWFEKWLEEGYIDRDWEITEGHNWKQIDYRSVKEEDKCRVYLELKSRNVSFESFKSTMIGENKLKKARNYLDNGAEVYFFFLFRGKCGKKRDLYYYDAKRCWKGLEKYVILDMGGTDKRGCNEYKNHLYIPTKFLTKVQKYKDMEEYHKFNKDLGKCR